MDKPKFFSGLAFLVIGAYIVMFGLKPLGYQQFGSGLDSIDTELRTMVEVFIGAAILMFGSGLWFVFTSFRK